MISLIAEAFSTRGWRDTGSDALRLAKALANDTDEPASAVSSAFLAQNQLGIEDVRSLLEALKPEVRTIRESQRDTDDLLVAIDDIDSFKSVRAVPPPVGAATAARLSLYEKDMKLAIMSILGEMYVDIDWGGELSDQFTTNVSLFGRRRHTAFLLKSSRSIKRKLRPSDLGKNADQIERLFRQEPDLAIVAHTGGVDESVHNQLRTGVRARRYEGHECFGSVWDGTDCSRLLIANGLVNSDGELLGPLGANGISDPTAG